MSGGKPGRRCSADSNERVQVVVRCRPMSQKEITCGYRQVVEVLPEAARVDLVVTKDGGKEVKQSFTFDAVFDSSASQERVYADTARPLVDSVLDGYNGTIFAYGQTGTGKTFTMEGCRASPDLGGVIPRSFAQIFDHVKRSAGMEFLIRASYLEIYQEEIRDLLSADRSRTYELRESADGGVYVKNLPTFVCKSCKELEHVMRAGNHNRSIGATNMNEHSSRSHAIFVVTVEMVSQLESAARMIRVGKLNLIDLSGSEKQGKTGATGERLREASKINLSLCALGKVISALVDAKRPHVPYRDSKLTRLLQDSLGGNSRTVMVANIGPANFNFEETLSTLRYASRTKNIKNKPTVNEDPMDTLLREYHKEIARLKEMLQERQKRIAIKDRSRGESSSQGDESGGSKAGAAAGAGGDGPGEDPSPPAAEAAAAAAAAEAEAEAAALREKLERERAVLERDRAAAEKLEMTIAAMESKLLRGGRRSFADHTLHQRHALDQRSMQIDECKRRELQMLQQLELKAESAVGIHHTCSGLQQLVNLRSRKLLRCSGRLACLRARISTAKAEFGADVKEVTRARDALLVAIKIKRLLIDNLVPPEVTAAVLRRASYAGGRWALAAAAPSEPPVPPPPSARPPWRNALSLLPEPAPPTAAAFPPPARRRSRSRRSRRRRSADDIVIDASTLSQSPPPPPPALPAAGPPSQRGCAPAPAAPRPLFPTARGLVPK